MSTPHESGPSLFPVPVPEHLAILLKHAGDVASSARHLHGRYGRGLLVAAIGEKPRLDVAFALLPTLTVSWLMAKGFTEEVAVSILESVRTYDLGEEALVMVLEKEKVPSFVRWGFLDS